MLVLSKSVMVSGGCGALGFSVNKKWFEIEKDGMSILISALYKHSRVFLRLNHKGYLS